MQGLLYFVYFGWQNNNASIIWVFRCTSVHPKFIEVFVDSLLGQRGITRQPAYKEVLHNAIRSGSETCKDE